MVASKHFRTYGQAQRSHREPEQDYRLLEWDGEEMNAEKENYLYETYPSLYRQHTLSMEQTCMCWGFECGDGWFDIINNLSQKLVEIATTVEAVQVKEKFGGLRFYIGPVDTDKSGLVYNLIR